MSTGREKLEKLLALANDKCNKFVSEMAYKKYLELKDKISEKEAVTEANCFDEIEEDNLYRSVEFDIDKIHKFFDTITKVPGGFLIRRSVYLNRMIHYYESQLRDFGEQYEGVRKNCNKMIKMYQQIAIDEFGYTKTSPSSLFPNTLINPDYSLFGNPKVNYLHFVDDDTAMLLDLDETKDAWGIRL